MNMTSHQQTPTPPPLSASRASTQYKSGYRKFIRAMRLALPIIAIALVGVVLIWPNLDSSKKFVIEEQTTPTLENASNELLNPRFESASRDNLPYSVIADKASQSAENENLVLLNNPSGNMTLKSGNIITMRALNGRYEQELRQLTLRDQVNITHDAGYTLEAEALNIDFQGNIIATDQPIIVDGPMGRIKATAMSADGEAQTLKFKGPAQMTLRQGGDKLNQFFNDKSLGKSF